MVEPDPDWYPDPAKTPGVFRWWTGEEWTDLLASDPDAPAPAADAVTRSVRPSGETSPGHALRNTLVLAGVLAAVLTVLTVLGFQPAGATRYPTDPPTDFGTPRVLAPKVSYDEKTRLASVRDRMSITMPAEPFGDPLATNLEDSLVTAGVASDLPVHEPSDTSSGWYGTALLGLVNPDVVADDDLPATAAAILDALGQSFYNSAPVETTELAPLEVGGEFAGFTGRISYDIEGVPSTHDDVVIVLAALDDGEVGLWAEVLPNDASEEAREEFATARGTLELN